MARVKTDQEILVLQRCARLLDELEDPRAQARIASFLVMRFTSEGERNLPSEERRKHLDLPSVQPEPDNRQMTIPGTDLDTHNAAPTRPYTATDARPATTPATTPVRGADGARTGRDAASDGARTGRDAASDTDPDTAPTRPAAVPRNTKSTIFKDFSNLNDDEEVEVEI
jgi:hypothetical protein